MSVSENVDPMNAAFGMFLRGVRLSQQIKMSRVGRAIGVTQTSVFYYETGQRKIPLVSFVRWCQCLNLDPGETMATVLRSVARQERCVK